MWSQAAMAMIGIWLMTVPGVWDLGKPVANNHHIVGPLMVTFSVVAIWECTRNVRWLNAPLAAWLLVAPWILPYEHLAALVNNYAVAVCVLLLCIVKPKRENHFGGGWPAVWKSGAPHSRLAGNPRRIPVKR